MVEADRTPEHAEVAEVAYSVLTIPRCEAGGWHEGLH